MSICSEFHGGVDAHVEDGLVVGSSNLDVVLAGWGVGWDIPAEWNIDGGVEGLSDFDVFVVEWGSVPVNVDVDLLDLHGGRDDTSEVEGKVDSLGDWVWGDGGHGFIEGEFVFFVSALVEDDFSGVDDLSLLEGLDHGLSNVSLHEVGWVEDWEVHWVVVHLSSSGTEGEDSEFHY